MTKSSSASTNNKSKVVKASKTTAKTSKPSSKSSSSTKKDQIFRYICEQHVMEITQVDKMDVALKVGNKNPRSEGFANAIKELTKTDGLITSGDTKDSITLTEKGIQAIPKDLEVSNDPSSVHDRYIDFIQQKAKMGADKVRPLWEILMDRKAHKVDDIAQKLGYKNPRSFMNTKIIQAMKDTGLLEQVERGVVRFTAKVPVVVGIIV